MSRISEFNGKQIDEIGQHILVELYDVDEALSPSEVADRVGVQRQSVWYRFNHTLADADLISKVSDGEYDLTLTGTFFVEANRDDLARPGSFTEIANEVQQARQEAESAKSSVQTYRQKSYRAKSDAKEALEQVKDIEEEAVTKEKLEKARTELQNEILSSIDARLDRVVNTLGDTSELNENTVVKELNAIHAAVRYHRDYIDQTWDSAQEHCSINEEHIKELSEELEEVDTELTRLQNESVDDDDGWLQALRK